MYVRVLGYRDLERFIGFVAYRCTSLITVLARKRIHVKRGSMINANTILSCTNVIEYDKHVL